MEMSIEKKYKQLVNYLVNYLLLLFSIMEIYSFSFSYSDGDHCFLISFLRMSEVRNCHFGYPQKDETRVTLLPTTGIPVVHQNASQKWRFSPFFGHKDIKRIWWCRLNTRYKIRSWCSKIRSWCSKMMHNCTLIDNCF